MIRFILYAFAVLLLGDVFCWWRFFGFLRRAKVAQGWTLAFTAFMLSEAAGWTLLFFSRLWLLPGLAHMGRLALSLVYIWHLLILPPICVFLVVALLLSALRSLLRPPPREGDDTPSSPSLRRFLGLAGISLAPAAGLALTGVALDEMNHFRIRRLTLRIPGMPPALDGLTIAHLSDTHVGELTSSTVLDALVRETNALNADLIAFTGDLINFDLADLPVGLRMFAALRARHGMFLCEGNHDLILSAAVFEAAARESGLNFLFNEEATIEIAGQPVQIIGLRWTDGYGPRLKEFIEKASALRRDDAFPIILAHHPHAFDPAEVAGFPLVLSGHTHGGQLMLTQDFGAGSFFFRYWSGLYRRGKSQLVVSNGTGNWFPLRINAPAEIIHLTLRAEI